MLFECWKPRFRSAVEGFKKACREKRFAAMNLRKNDTRILGKAFLEKNPQTGSPRSEILSSARMVCSSSQESWEVWAPEAGSSLTTSGYVKLEQQRKNVEESVKRCHFGRSSDSSVNPLHLLVGCWLFLGMIRDSKTFCLYIVAGQIFSDIQPGSGI